MDFTIHRMRDSAFPRPPTSRGIPAESKPAKDKSGSGNRLQRNAARLSHERMMTRCHTHSCLVRARPRTRSRCSTPATPPSEVNALDFDGVSSPPNPPSLRSPSNPRLQRGLIDASPPHPRDKIPRWPSPTAQRYSMGRSRRISPWDPRTSRTWWLGSANPFHPGDTPLSTT